MTESQLSQAVRDARADVAARRIVVGVDRTPSSRRVIGEAVRIATSLDAELELVCVYRDVLDLRWTWPSFMTDEQVESYTYRALRDMVDQAGPAARRVTMSVIVLAGNPAQDLICRARDAAMLIVGGRRGSTLEHTALGSVTTRCIEHAAVPVLVVQDAEPAADGLRSGPSAGRVVVGVDGSPAARDALRWAGITADILGVGIDALTVIAPPVYVAGADATYLPAGGWDWQAHGTRALAAEVTAVFGQAPPYLRQIVEEGHPAHHLIDRSRGAAMLVIGNRGRGGFRSLLLGSVSLKCANQAHCPVLVVHSLAHSPGAAARSAVAAAAPTVSA